MKSKEKLVRMLYLSSAILFFIAAIIGKNYVFIPIGCCFIVLGITQSNNKE
ncbi:hypothetical protein [Clostridium sp. UBA4548]|uniref:hypothetical protein n=1 Tax=Clostridium sp. UBA4548 TaxID=1946361 RepID=UPI0025BFB316|nr:hypothetical protein [Clostridium sp. UBA4548]